MKFGNLRVNDLKNPIGVDRLAPIFSFSCEGEGIFFVSLFAEGEVDASDGCTVTSSECGGFRFRSPLLPCKRYRWQVSDGRSTMNAFLETGVDFSFPFFRLDGALSQCHRFYVPVSTLRARLYRAGGGNCRVTVNGETLGKSYPNLPHDDGKRTCYRTYEIESLLWRGDENMLTLSVSKKEAFSVAAGVILFLSDGRTCVIPLDEHNTVPSPKNGLGVKGGI